MGGLLTRSSPQGEDSGPSRPAGCSPALPRPRRAQAAVAVGRPGPGAGKWRPAPRGVQPVSPQWRRLRALDSERSRTGQQEALEFSAPSPGTGRPLPPRRLPHSRVCSQTPQPKSRRRSISSPPNTQQDVVKESRASRGRPPDFFRLCDLGLAPLALEPYCPLELSLLFG